MDTFENKSVQNVENITLDKWIKKLKRGKMILLSSLGIFMVIGLFYSLTTDPIYQAQVKIQIESNLEEVVPIGMGQVMPRGEKPQEFYLTQYIILKSRSLAKSVIQKLKLEESEEFDSKPSLFAPIKKLIKSVIKLVIPRGEGNGVQSEDPYSKLVDKFLRRLIISPVRNSRIVEIRYQSKSPELAAQIANSVAEQYIQRNMEWRTNSEGEGRDWLKQRLVEISEQIKISEAALQDFKDKNNIVVLDGVRNFEPLKLQEITSQYNHARDERLKLESYYRRLKSIRDPFKLLDSIQETAGGKKLAKLKADYSQLILEQIELSKRVGPTHPEMISKKQKLEALESRIPAEVGKFIQGVYVEFKTSLDREKELQKTFQKQESRIKDLDKSSVEYNSLMQEVESSKKLYDMFLVRMKELNFSSRYKESNVRIVDPAEVPEDPVKPRKLFNLIISSFLGFMFGITVLVGREMMNKTIVTVEDVEEEFPFPFLGGIGVIDSKELPLPSLNTNRSLVAEEFRVLRTNMMRSPLVENKKVIMVSSSTPQEGKTTIVSNLGISYARQNMKVLIIDADCVRPKMHLSFEVESQPGLIELLEGKESLSKCIVQTKVKGLSLLPVGGLSDQFTEVFHPESFAKTLDQLKAKYDIILIDTPPVLAFSYVTIIAQNCDAILFTIGSGLNDKSFITRSLKQLAGPAGSKNLNGKAINGNKVQTRPVDGVAKILGITLNKINFSKDDYYDSYMKHYKGYYDRM